MLFIVKKKIASGIVESVVNWDNVEDMWAAGGTNLIRFVSGEVIEVEGDLEKMIQRLMLAPDAKVIYLDN